RDKSRPAGCTPGRGAYRMREPMIPVNKLSTSGIDENWHKCADEARSVADDMKDEISKRRYCCHQHSPTPSSFGRDCSRTHLQAQATKSARLPQPPWRSPQSRTLSTDWFGSHRSWQLCQSLIALVPC